jgi:hypothetical protein
MLVVSAEAQTLQELAGAWGEYLASKLNPTPPDGFVVRDGSDPVEILAARALTFEAIVERLTR